MVCIESLSRKFNLARLENWDIFFICSLERGRILPAIGFDRSCKKKLHFHPNRTRYQSYVGCTVCPSCSLKLPTLKMQLPPLKKCSFCHFLRVPNLQSVSIRPLLLSNWSMVQGLWSMVQGLWSMVYGDLLRTSTTLSLCTLPRVES